MALKRTLRAPAGVATTLQLPNGLLIQNDGSGFVRVPQEFTDDLLGAGYSLPENLPRLAVATNRTGMQYLGQSSGSSQTVTYRTRHITLKGSRVAGLRLVFSNTELTASGEFDAPVNVTLRVSVEIGGVFYKVFFGGKRDVVVEPGAFVGTWSVSPADRRSRRFELAYAGTFCRMRSGSQGTRSASGILSRAPR